MQLQEKVNPLSRIVVSRKCSVDDVIVGKKPVNQM